MKKPRWWLILAIALGGYCCTSELIGTMNPTPLKPCTGRPEQIALKYPLDLAVSRDGNTVYTNNGNCSDINGFHRLAHTREQITCGNKDIEYSYFYKITANQHLELLQIQGKPVLPCEHNDDIESDSQDNLYVSKPSQDQLYKIQPQQDTITLLATVPEKKISGPWDLYMDHDQLFYSMHGDIEGYRIINRLEADRHFSNILRTKRFFIFGIYRNLLYIKSDFTENILEFDLSKAIPVTSANLYTTPEPLIMPEYKFNEEFYHKTKAIYQGLSITRLRTNSQGHLFVNDLKHHMIWKIIPHQEVIAFAGSGQPGYKDGKGIEAQFYFPTAMAFDAADNLYVADTGNHAIRKITPDGTVTTFYKEANPN